MSHFLWTGASGVGAGKKRNISFEEVTLPPSVTFFYGKTMFAAPQRKPFYCVCGGGGQWSVRFPFFVTKKILCGKKGGAAVARRKLRGKFYKINAKEFYR